MNGFTLKLGRRRVLEPSRQHSGDQVALAGWSFWGDGYWRRQFAADPSVPGRKIVMNGLPLFGPKYASHLLDWYRGTGLRPFLEALAGEEERRNFERRVLDRYIAAYPRQPDGHVLFPFKRLFFVAYR